MQDAALDDRYRKRIKDLIAEAVVEPDDARRYSLLWMADEWLALLARRVSGHENGAGRFRPAP